MNQSFSKIWIVVPLVILVVGGIFAWQYFGAPEEEIGEVGKDGCIITGCSGQICSDEGVITTCEYLPQDACYKNAVCERQSNGTCGWTQTSELTQCLLQAKSAKRTLLDTSNWQTYRNEEYGFEFQYPRKFAEDQEYSGNCKARQIEPDLFAVASRVRLEVRSISEATLSEHIKEQVHTETGPYPYIEPGSIKETVPLNILGSDEALKITHFVSRAWSGSGGSGDGETAFIRKSPSLFVINYTDGISACFLEKEGIGDKEVFQKILSTFRFVDGNNSSE